MSITKDEILKTEQAVTHENAPNGSDIELSEDFEQEPEFHIRTWFAVAAMFLLNLVQVFALTGPPVVVRVT